MVVLLFFAFLSGLVTILAPCIWPLLPVIFSASALGGRGKPLGITLGICLSFAVFTLSVSYLVRLFNFDPNILRLLAVGVIGFLGLSLVIPWLSARVEAGLGQVGGKLHLESGERSGFGGGLISGLALGIVWSPCAGPILATIATLAVTRAVGWQIVLVTVVYVIGVGIPLFLLTRASNSFFNRARSLNKYTGRIQQGFGVLMIAAAILMYSNYDKVFSAKLLDLIPSYSVLLTNLENNPGVQKELNYLRGGNQKAQQLVGKAVSGGNMNILPDFGPAPEFTGIIGWLNTETSPSLQSLRGKVVLVDFWTYTCINCIRTLPYVTGWYEKYKDQGFVVVGIHTPEFEFEKKTENVQMAIAKFGIHYPVALDNDYGTWNAYGNQYWPAEYLIDAKGHLRHTHFGEGNYVETELAIKNLLEEAGKTTDENVIADTIPNQTPQRFITPETYIGLARQGGFSSPEAAKAGEQNYSLPATVPSDSFAFDGKWNLTSSAAVTENGSNLVLHFKADKVFLVAGPANLTAGQGQKTGQIKVFIDGIPAGGETAGKDVFGGVVNVNREDTYELIDLRGRYGDHLLRLEFSTPGMFVYVFTFG